MPIANTALYAGICAFMLIGLALRVIRHRYQAKIGLLDGGDEVLRRHIRVHGNFTEYVPTALLLMAIIEVNGAPWWVIHPLGLALAGGRIAHAVGLRGSTGASRPRVAGMMATFGVLTVAGLIAIAQFAWSLVG
ncbi:MAG: MAPEG family protein [Rhodospirillaceae bacterium]|nr:MAPEG family protein [Rhodospirillaceae bacterium]